MGLDAISAFTLAWNGVHLDADWPALWRGLRAEAPQIAARAVAWEQQVTAHGDLAANLLAFAQSIKGG